MMLRKRWIQREKVKAVHEDDLRGFLSSIGVLDQIENGRCHCSVCGAQIDLNNLSMVFPDKGRIQFVCDRVSCLNEIESVRKDSG